MLFDYVFTLTVQMTVLALYEFFQIYMKSADSEIYALFYAFAI